MIYLKKKIQLYIGYVMLLINIKAIRILLYKPIHLYKISTN